jgi:hypothetical protein
VIAEVYALNSLVALIILDAASGAVERDPGHPVAATYCFLVGLLFGFASGNHLLVLLWLPGLSWLAAAALRSGALRRAGAVAALVGLLAGLAPFLALRATIERGESLRDLVARVARNALVPDSPLRDLGSWAGYLLYQFPVPLMLAAAAIGIARLWRHKRAQAVGLGLLYATTAAFAFSYQVKDRFAFYLPSYLAIAIAGACGLDAILSRLPGRRAALISAALVCVAAPPAVYILAGHLAGPMLAKLGLAVRDLPGRDAVLYHLYPGKAGYNGARRFGEESFALLEPRAVVLADYTVEEPMRYMQVVEGKRRDLEIFYASPRSQLQVVIEKHRLGQEVYLGANDSYYDIEGISTRFEVVPAGPLFHLIAR